MVAVKSGLLSKRGNAGFKSFVDRYVAIRKTDEKTDIAYWKVAETEEQGSAQGSLAINKNSSIVVSSDKYRGRQHVFAVFNEAESTTACTVVTVSGDEFESIVTANEGNIFVFAGKSEVDAEEWTAAIKAIALETTVLASVQANEKAEKVGFTVANEAAAPRPVAASGVVFRAVADKLKEDKKGKADVKLQKVGKKKKVKALQFVSISSILAHNGAETLVVKHAGDVHIVVNNSPFDKSISDAEIVNAVATAAMGKQEANATLKVLTAGPNTLFHVAKRAGLSRELLVVLRDASAKLLGKQEKGETLKDEDVMAAFEIAPLEARMIIPFSRKATDAASGPVAIDLVTKVFEAQQRALSIAQSAAVDATVEEEDDDEETTVVTPVVEVAPPAAAVTSTISTTPVSGVALTVALAAGQNTTASAPAYLLQKQGNGGFKAWTNRAVSLTATKTAGEVVHEVAYYAVDAKATDAASAIELAGGLAGARGRMSLAANTAVWAGLPLAESASEENQLRVLIFDCSKVRTARAVGAWTYAAAKALFDSAAATRKFTFKGQGCEVFAQSVSDVIESVRDNLPADFFEPPTPGRDLKRQSEVTVDAEAASTPEVVVNEVAAPVANPVKAAETSASALAVSAELSACYPIAAFVPLKETSVEYPVQRHIGKVVGVVIPASISVEGGNVISAEVPSHYTTARWSYRSLVDGFDLVVLECPHDVALPVLAEAIEFPAVAGVHPGLILYPLTSDIAESFCSLHPEFIQQQHQLGMAVEEIETAIESSIRNAVCSLGMSLGERRLAFAPPQDAPSASVLAATIVTSTPADRRPFVEGKAFVLPSTVTEPRAASVAPAIVHDTVSIVSTLRPARNLFCFANCLNQRAASIKAVASKNGSIQADSIKTPSVAASNRQLIVSGSIVGSKVSATNRVSRSLITPADIKQVEAVIEKLQADKKKGICC